MSQSDRDALVEKYLPLVRYVVARIPVSMPSSIDRDDFYSAGTIGLINAAENYDPERGASFKTFAYTAIRGAILDELRRHDPVSRGRRNRLRKLDREHANLSGQLGREPTIEELAEALGMPEEELDRDLLVRQTSRLLSLHRSEQRPEGSSSLLEQLASDKPGDPKQLAEIRDDVGALANAIGDLPPPERNVVILYHYEELYLKEIGRLLGVTESRVSQILSRATARLRAKLES